MRGDAHVRFGGAGRGNGSNREVGTAPRSDSNEWAKRRAQAEGLAFTELANGFASCVDPDRLQAICDRLGPADLQAFFDRWMASIPTPLNTTDQEARYLWELSMLQIETSRTLVFDAPRRARGFFEALVADNLDIGRPDEVQLTFGRQIRSNTDSPFSTKVVTRGVDVIVNVFYKHSRIKEYLKEGRALRIETVCNSPTDLGCKRRIHNLPELQAKARAANRRLLTIQRAGQGCARSLSGSHCPRLRRANEPEPCASGIRARWPWSAVCASPSTPWPASPTGASVPRSPVSSPPTTPRRR